VDPIKTAASDTSPTAHRPQARRRHAGSIDGILAPVNNQPRISTSAHHPQTFKPTPSKPRFGARPQIVHSFRSTAHKPAPAEAVKIPKTAPFAHVKKQPQAVPQPPTKQRGRILKTIRSLLKIALQAMVIITLLIVGLFSRYAIIGQAAIGLYAVFALLMKIESRTTFILAVMALAVVLIASLRGDAVLAGSFAIYAFLLLAIGAITLGREIHNA